MLKEPMEVPAQLPQELSSWIERNIKKPICGFEHKKKANGTEYCFEEQVKATRYQLKLIAYSYLQRGKSAEEVLLRLQWFC